MAYGLVDDRIDGHLLTHFAKDTKAGLLHRVDWWLLAWERKAMETIRRFDAGRDGSVHKVKGSGCRSLLSFQRICGFVELSPIP